MNDTQIKIKRCSMCGCEKELSEFHHNKASADGHTSRCKLCTKIIYEQNKDKVKEYYRKNREKCIAQATEYRKQHINGRRKNAKARAKHNNWVNRYKKENPVKVKAQSAVGLAILQGKLPKAKTLLCSNCGKSATEYHHWSYEPEHWLDVVPLCHYCHMKIHSSRKSDD